jgi:predicted short-subunit dehydrogenase-like oxidoreductase (DUF2520 family)
MHKKRISFAGAGRVGGAICMELYQAGYTIDLIVTESEKSSKLLADKCKASWSGELVFPDSTDVIIVAVPDHKIISVLNTLKCSPETLISHTAGSFGLEVFPEEERNYGVFYPLQTFTKGRNLNFREIPLLIEAKDRKSSETLEELAKSICDKVYFTDSEHRKVLHVAAVFVSNFTNHLLTLGKEVSLKGGFEFEILKPLIVETISKALAMGPENSQTGPAIRNDLNTMEKQFDLLSFSPELQELYKLMTQSIISYYKEKNKS